MPNVVTIKTIQINNLVVREWYSSRHSRLLTPLSMRYRYRHNSLKSLAKKPGLIPVTAVFLLICSLLPSRGSLSVFVPSQPVGDLLVHKIRAVGCDWRDHSEELAGLQ